MLTAAARVGRHLLAERIARAKAQTREDVPGSCAAVTTTWLTDVLQPAVPGVEVLDFAFGSGSAGTHERRRLFLAYNEIGRRAGLPPSMFVKVLPDLRTRMLVGFMGHARYESLFYERVRPGLEIETPRSYFTGSDRDSFAAFHLLEDVATTKGATFLDERVHVTREMAEGMVDLLARLHATFWDAPSLEDELGWLVEYATWFDKGVERVRTDRHLHRAIEQARDVIPPRMYARRREIWPAVAASVAPHRSGTRTLIHSDVHVGNWYRTAAGRMGILDWQVLTRGHWARDLSYALSSSLTIADRRNWETELVQIYVDRIAELVGVSIPPERAWSLYVSQLWQALIMWTQTLSHPILQPNSQRDEMTFELIRRIATAIDDLEALDMRIDDDGVGAVGGHNQRAGE